MMRNSTYKRVTSWLILLAFMHVAPVYAWAQCAMCKTAAENLDPAGVKYLNVAIVLLLMPPASMFCGFFYLAYKRRDAPGRTSERNEQSSDDNDDTTDLR
jgi:hypothetical protein